MTNDHAKQPTPHVRVMRGLLLREWLAHRNFLGKFIMPWIIALWVLLLFCNPAVVLAAGCLLAVMAASSVGGLEAMEGTEEFTFALPPTRGRRYTVRAMVGLCLLMSLILITLLATAANLPQIPWRLVVDSGFTEPFATIPYESLFYALAISAPLTVFCLTFAAASNAASRVSVNTACILGLALAGGLTGVSFVVEEMLWGRLSGLICVPVHLAASATAIWAGYHAYTLKEAAGGRLSNMTRLTWTAAMFVAGMCLLATVIWFNASSDHRRKYNDGNITTREAELIEATSLAPSEKK